MLKFTLKNYHTFIILFLLNITTNIIYAQTQTFPPNQAVNIQPPIDLQWSATSGNVDIEIYECSVDASAPIGTIDLSGYVLQSGPIDIPVYQEDDLSGITYNPLIDRLFMVVNGVPIVYETDLAGVVKREIPLYGFEDTEGIVHLGGTEYAVIEEKKAELFFLKSTLQQLLSITRQMSTMFNSPEDGGQSLIIIRDWKAFPLHLPQIG